MSAKAVKHHTAEDMLLRIIRVAEILAKGQADAQPEIPDVHLLDQSNLNSDTVLAQKHRTEVPL
jgi:hypothetical protein